MKNHIWIRAVGMRYLRIIALAWDIILCPVVMFSPAFQAFLLDPEIDDFQKRQEAGGKQERGKTNGWVDVLFAIFPGFYLVHRRWQKMMFLWRWGKPRKGSRNPAYKNRLQRSREQPPWRRKYSAYPGSGR